MEYSNNLDFIDDIITLFDNALKTKETVVSIELTNKQINLIVSSLLKMRDAIEEEQEKYDILFVQTAIKIHEMNGMVLEISQKTMDRYQNEWLHLEPGFETAFKVKNIS